MPASASWKVMHGMRDVHRGFVILCYSGFAMGDAVDPCPEAGSGNRRNRGVALSPPFSSQPPARGLLAFATQTMCVVMVHDDASVGCSRSRAGDFLSCTSWHNILVTEQTERTMFSFF